MSGRLDAYARVPALVRLGDKILAGRGPQSLLLVGPEGSGKDAAALELARRVLCEHAPRFCTESFCASCHRVTMLAHPDLQLVFPAEASLGPESLRELLRAKAAEPLARLPQPSSAIIPVGDADDPSPVSARSIRAFVGVKPFEGKRRVVVMSEAHRMNRAAANALLKTLEEPPPTALLMLCTHQPHALPATIRSRCARCSVPALSDAELAAHLQTYDLDADEAARLAAVAGGNTRRAFDLLDPTARELATWATGLLEMVLTADTARLLKAAEMVAKGQDPLRAGGKARRISDGSLSAARDVGMRVLDFLVSDLLALAKLQSGAEIDGHRARGLRPWLERAGGYPFDRAARELLAARDDLARNVNVALVLTDGFRRLATLESTASGAAGR